MARKPISIMLTIAVFVCVIVVNNFGGSSSRIENVEVNNALTSSTRPSSPDATTTTTATTTTATTRAPISVDLDYAVRALLYDVTNDEILFEKDAYSKCYPASTTKLLTASVALSYLSGNTMMHVGDEIKMIASDSSVCGIKQGYKMTLYQLIAGLLMSSGNDAAYTIAVNVARHVSGDPNMSNEDGVKYFAELMNSYAKSLGATTSNFVNPDGYHNPNHYSTVYDLLLITKHSMDFSVIRNVVSHTQTTLLTFSGEFLTFRSTNLLINPNSEYYYPHATGFKTGMTNRAGYCLIATATKDEQTIISIVMGSPIDQGRWIDTTKLLNSYFS